MANIMERDIVMQGQDDSGNPTIDLPITRLGNIEDTADVKDELAATDYLPLLDMADNGQMKKILASVLLAAVKQGITLAGLGAAAAKHEHDTEDITSGTLAADRIPDLAASKITSGTFASARLPTVPLTKGGTGQTTLTPAVGTKALRAIYAGTTDMTAGSSALTTGLVYLCYE